MILAFLRLVGANIENFPLPYAIPLGLQYTAYTNNQVAFKWNSITGASGYEYAVNTIAKVPSTGTHTSLTSALVTSLIADTDYFIHVRTIYPGNNYSDWSTIYFRSANNPVSLPYSEGFENLDTITALPENTRSQVIDSLNYKPGEDYIGSTYKAPIATYNDGLEHSGTNYLLLNANLDTVPIYFYLPGLKLIAGTKYTLKFSYLPGVYYPNGNDSAINHLDALTINSGMAVGGDSATTTILNLPYRNLNQMTLILIIILTLLFHLQ